jgi:hypothetical protein
VIRFHRALSCAIPVVLTSVVAVACKDKSDQPPAVDKAEAFTAIVRWEVAQHPPVRKPDGSTGLLVIYIAAALGDRIDAGTQARVADATKGQASVRFADRREDVVDMSDKAEPVKDDQVMLLVGSVPDPAASIDVEVVRYRSLDDQTKYELVIAATADGAQVTRSTEAPS